MFVVLLKDADEAIFVSFTEANVKATHSCMIAMLVWETPQSLLFSAFIGCILYNTFLHPANRGLFVIGEHLYIRTLPDILGFNHLFIRSKVWMHSYLSKIAVKATLHNFLGCRILAEKNKPVFC